MKIDQQFGYIDELRGKGEGEKRRGGEWEKLLVNKFPLLLKLLFIHIFPPG